MTLADRSTAAEGLYDNLVKHRLILPLGVSGISGCGPVFEDVLHGFLKLVDRVASIEKPEALHFPPVIPRQLLENSGFLNAFPHLAGTIFSFAGTDTEHRLLQEAIAAGEDWSVFETMTEVALTSAACYPVYGTASGILPPGGRVFDVTSYCFRHEPSSDPTRLQSFRMRELVRLGTPDEVMSWRAAWMDRSCQLLLSLGLPVRLVDASDPFFGRAGRLLAANQKEQKLKFELVVPILSDEQPTAVMSFNYHADHFTARFNISTAPDAVAHSACLGFGLERIVIALFRIHGFQPADWPSEIRSMLWPQRS